MRRRSFLAAAGSAVFASQLPLEKGLAAPDANHGEHCSLKYASPREAMLAPRETLAYTTAIREGTASTAPDYLATIDLDPKSSTYSQVIHRLPMPKSGDELHHFGWNACSSCLDARALPHSHIILPGLKSSRVHIVDVADPRAPKIIKVIEPEEIAKKTNLSAPHTVHCLADGTIMISMLGDAAGNAPGGFLLLDQKFDIAGRWDKPGAIRFNYDFWYQPRHNVMVSSEWAAPKTYGAGFDLKQVEAGNYGSRLYFWDWKRREVTQQVELGAAGLIPLEVRFHHNPASTHGYVGAALSSVMWHYHRDGDKWAVNKAIEVQSIDVKGWPFPVPGLITDLLVSLDDRYLYFSNWLHGDVRQYDISDPAKPRLAGQLWLGGVLGKAPKHRGKELGAGPQMLQLSLDGKRLYVTNSLLSSWDNQFYPNLAKSGSYMLQVDCDTAKGGLTLNDTFFVDFGQEPGGPARAHEMRFPNGDCTSDIWV